MQTDTRRSMLSSPANRDRTALVRQRLAEALRTMLVKDFTGRGGVGFGVREGTVGKVRRIIVRAGRIDDGENTRGTEVNRDWQAEMKLNLQWAFGETLTRAFHGNVTLTAWVENGTIVHVETEVVLDD